MFENTKKAVTSCKSVYSRKNEIVKKLIRNPFFPLLFVGEVTKTTVITFASTGAIVTPVTIALLILAIVATVMWIFAEHLLDEAEETYNEVIDND